MKGYKRVFNVYSAWDYAREIEDLNKMSEKGWQLVKGGLFSNLYQKNEDLRYRFQIDYNPKIQDMARYIETFREQGWEYVNSTINGWHYFRKLYDQAAGEDYEIYNDSQSLKEMQAKWQRNGIIMIGVLIAAVILQIVCMIREFAWANAVLAALLLAEAFVIGRGVYVLRNPQRADGRKRSWNGMPAFFSIFFIGIIAVLILLFLK